MQKTTFSFEDTIFPDPALASFNPKPIDEEASMVFSELLQQSQGILSFLQLYIVYLRLIGMSYSDITLELDIKSWDAIKRAILCTVEGRKGYLGDVDEKLFIDTIKEQAHDLNCFTLSEAVEKGIHPVILYEHK